MQSAGNCSANFNPTSCVFQPVPSGQKIPDALFACKQILDVIAKVLPGLLQAIYFNAKAKFLAGTITFKVFLSDVTSWFGPFQYNCCNLLKLG